MAKKQKKATSERVPTKHQLSKWQRQMKIRRIVIITAVVFLAGILSWVGYEYYKDYKSDPLREVVIEVNDVPVTMEYFVKMIDAHAYIAGWNSTVISYAGSQIADMVADDIINVELMRQAAKEDLGIEVTADEVDGKIEEGGWPNERVYRDIVSATLLQEKLEQHFASQLPETMEQAHAQVMLLESQKVADDVIARIEASGNFTALAEEFSCNSSVERDLGWLPRELMPNTSIADVAYNLTPGQISQPIYDGTATKNIGYWLIEVTDAQNETINAQVMLLTSEAKAEQVEAELAAGGNFSALAGNYSQHESKTNGGKLDGLEPGDMGSTAFDQVAFNITLNQVSEPVRDESVQTTGGYWIVKVIDRGERELDEQLREELKDKRWNDWFEELKEDSTIENLLDAAKKSWAINKVLQGR
ncbi:MAG: peptidylprolyl isomerase [Dehalococcoidia bacterium]